MPANHAESRRNHAVNLPACSHNDGTPIRYRLDRETDAGLRRVARRIGRSEEAVVERAIIKYLEAPPPFDPASR